MSERPGTSKKPKNKGKYYANAHSRGKGQLQGGQPPEQAPETRALRRYADEGVPVSQHPSRSKKPFQGQKLHGIKASGPRRLSCEEMDKVKPLAMSTTSKDNNVWATKNGILAVGITSMVLERDVPKFSLEFSQYIVLAEASYLSLSRVDKGLRATTTEAMYLYYAVVLLYRRTLTILSHNGEFVGQHQDMENIFRGFQYYCLKDPAMYLGSIGNVVDYTDHLAYFNIQSRFNLQSILVAKGHFGKAATSTHWKYGTMPAPLVFLHRIMKDLRVSTVPGVSADWNIPADLIASALGYDLKPNVDLLGWAPAVPMSGDQKREVIRCSFVV